MQIAVNGVRLFFDVEGEKLAIDGPGLREKPTLLVLHGGPGFDHSALKPELSRLADIAQIIYLDHRGNGRSEDGDPALWLLPQWADDVKAFCDALGIVKPIVFGHSFGGFVAQGYASAYPDHPSKVILAMTAPRLEVDVVAAAFGRRGGPAAAEAARAFLERPSPQTGLPFMTICRPLYSATGKLDEERGARQILKSDVLFKFFDPEGPDRRMDYRAALARVKARVLLIAGLQDPIVPPVYPQEILAHLPNGLGRLELLEDCGHFLTDAWPRIEAAIRRFISED